MLYRLQISLAQLIAGNNSEIQAIIVFFILIKKTYKRHLQKFDYLKMEILFMNTENIKTMKLIDLN